MKGSDDGWLSEARIAAHDTDTGHSYLYVPGQLLVHADDADEVRRDLERRGLLDGKEPATSTAASAAFDSTTMRRVGKLLGRERLADLLRVRQERGRT